MVACMDEQRNASDRARRLAENESLFRDVNERIRDVGQEFDVAQGERARFVCECDDANCTEGVEITVSDYERVRQEPTHFIVVPGHEDLEVERVVEEQPRCYVVKKREGPGAEAARDGDPRA